MMRRKTITIKNEEDDEVGGGGYQLNGASTIPTAGFGRMVRRVEDETKVGRD